MSIYVHEAITQRKPEQNDIARRFFTGLGGGFGLDKKYQCKLCGEIIGAPSPRLAALYHRNNHPEITEAFQEAGLHDLWVIPSWRDKET